MFTYFFTYICCKLTLLNRLYFEVLKRTAFAALLIICHKNTFLSIFLFQSQEYFSHPQVRKLCELTMCYNEK